MAHSKSHYRSTLKKARGMGAAHSGTHHFWIQRVTALAIIPLAIWFMVKLVSVLAMADRAAVGEWFTHPLNAVLLASLVVALFWHAKLGVQVIIEDYVHTESKKIALLLFSGAAHTLLGLASVVSIVRLHFIGM